MPEGLTRLMVLTPFSCEAFHLAVNDAGHGMSRVEWTRRFYLRARQARTGLAQTATLGRWANCKTKGSLRTEFNGHRNRLAIELVVAQPFRGIQHGGKVDERRKRRRKDPDGR